MKLGFQILLALLSLVPLYFGVVNMWVGAARFLPAEDVTAAMDSQFRFQSAYYLGLAFMIWRIIPDPGRHTGVFRILIGVLFLGGLARVYSYLTIGAPPSNMMAGMALELVLPLLLIWQGRLARGRSAIP